MATWRISKGNVDCCRLIYVWMRLSMSVQVDKSNLRPAVRNVNDPNYLALHVIVAAVKDSYQWIIEPGIMS